MASGKKTTVEIAGEIAEKLIEELGLTLWDVTFTKEGSVWMLRYLIDKEGGLSIDDCEKFSRGIDLVLDEVDPINKAYTLEVSSPGVERDLTKDWHFEVCKGEDINIRLIRPVEGVRDFVGELVDYKDGTLTMMIDEDVEMELKKSETAYIRLYFEF